MGFVASARRHPVLVGVSTGLVVAAVFATWIVVTEWGFARPALASAPPEWWERERAGALRLVASSIAAGLLGGLVLGRVAARIEEHRRLKLLALAGIAYCAAAVAGAATMLPEGQQGPLEAAGAILLASVVGGIAYGIFLGPLVVGAALALEWLTRRDEPATSSAPAPIGRPPAAR